jgi:hypothetical protein
MIENGYAAKEVSLKQLKFIITISYQKATKIIFNLKT